MKYIIFSLVILLSCGCAILDRSEYVAIRTPSVKTKKITKYPENLGHYNFKTIHQSIVGLDGAKLEVLSFDHDSKLMSAGIFIPIIPLFWIYYLGPDSGYNSEPIVRVKNLSTHKTIQIQDISYSGEDDHSSKIGTEHIDKIEFRKAPLDLMELEPKETLWIELQDFENVVVQVEVEGISYDLNFKQGHYFNGYFANR